MVQSAERHRVRLCERENSYRRCPRGGTSAMPGETTTTYRFPMRLAQTTRRGMLTERDLIVKW
jgi:hypothetical protein